MTTADRPSRRTQVVEALAGAQALADDLGHALTTRGRRCRRVSLAASAGPPRLGSGRGHPGDDLVIVDGRFLQHPKLRGAWELVVFLREGADGDQDRARYLEQVDPPRPRPGRAGLDRPSRWPAGPVPSQRPGRPGRTPGRRRRADDLLAPDPLSVLLHGAGWSLERYDDGPDRFLARASRRDPLSPERPTDRRA